MKIDKEELIRKVREVEGLSNDEKAALIGYIKTKTYGLVWEDSTEKVWEQLKDYIPVLTEDKSKAIINDTDEQKNPNHILIEGDNLLALTNLCFTHEEKVDVIYIDPPYNTGKEFVYNDKRIDKENEFRHSQWITFMEKRLRLAKKLLSKEGVIFISIDDNEQANLKLLCDNIFGEDNFAATYFWKRTETPPALSYKVRRKLEYVLCYTKCNIKERQFAQGYVDGGDAPLLNSGNPIGKLSFPIGSVHFNIPDGTYTHTPSHKIELLSPVNVVNGVNSNTFSARANFKWQQSNLEREVEEGTYFLIKSNQFSIRYQKATKATKVPSNIIDADVEVGTNEAAAKMLEDIGIFGFDYAKPVSLVQYLIRMPFWDKNELTVLDFFAGSGTTLHATMQLNAEDGGHRQCILVQGIEKDDDKNDLYIAEKITYERNKKVIEGYTKQNGEFVEGLKDNNLRYFKIGYIPREKDMTNIERFARQSVNLLCIKEDIYKEQTMFGNLEADGFRYFKDGDKQFLVILEPDMIEPIIEELTKMDFEGKMPVYVFTTGHYPYTEDFWQANERVDLYPYPYCVYGACEKVMPKMEDKLLDLPDNVELSDEEANMTFEDLNKG